MLFFLKCPEILTRLTEKHTFVYVCAYKEFNSESSRFISVQRQFKLNELCSNTLWLLVPSSTQLVSLCLRFSFSHPFLLPSSFLAVCVHMCSCVCPGLSPSPCLNPCLAWLQHFLLMVT